MAEQSPQPGQRPQHPLDTCPAGLLPGHQLLAARIAVEQLLQCWADRLQQMMHHLQTWHASAAIMCSTVSADVMPSLN